MILCRINSVKYMKTLLRVKAKVIQMPFKGGDKSKALEQSESQRLETLA